MRTLIVAVALLCVATQASAWWNADWTGRKTLSVNTTAGGLNTTSELRDVPVLLRLHTGTFPQFLNVKEGGADFRLIDGDDQTPLKFHVEKFDAAAQIALLWVRVPVLKPQTADNKIYLYYGNASAPAAEDAGATYETNTAAVLHFADASGKVVDSTAYATPITATIASNPMSLIGNGALLDGTAPLVIDDAPNLRLMPEKGWSVAFWFKLDELPKKPAYLFDRGQGAQRASVMIKDGQLVASAGGVEFTSTVAPAVGKWIHLGLALTGGHMHLYVDGAMAGDSAVPVSDPGTTIAIGGAVDGTGTLVAAIDEVKIAVSARDDAAFAAEAAIEGEGGDRVITYGGDETADSAGGGKAASHFGIIIQNVFGRKEAIVEQSVIGVCVVMAAIALMVMFMKAVYLSRCRRATDKFLRAYHTQMASTGAALNALVKGEKSYGDSPLFKIYRQGVEQVEGRLAHSVGAAVAGLPDKSLNAIRATLDAVAVREQQRLNSLLVLLTIAISGGPFIGLLGTVVGVMVTFATIAETGDINIASIAPGMAAALLATVAGLGVAIPSLFGYNYLSAKAKEIVADMHVFGDEFVAKVNEVHGL